MIQVLMKSVLCIE